MSSVFSEANINKRHYNSIGIARWGETLTRILKTHKKLGFVLVLLD